jgi:hypothetical protein
MTTITARNVRGGITEDSFTDLTTAPVSSIEPGQSITVTFDGVLTDAESCAVIRRIETADPDAEQTRGIVEGTTFAAGRTDSQRLTDLEAAFVNLRAMYLGGSA